MPSIFKMDFKKIGTIDIFNFFAFKRHYCVDYEKSKTVDGYFLAI